MSTPKFFVCLLACLIPATLANAQIPDSLLVPSPPFTATASQTIITAQDILERGYDNLDELLNSVQGIFLTHDRNTTQIGLRGVSPGRTNNQRILILLDNIPLNDPLTGEAPSGHELRGISMEEIREVIVIRNPSSLEYGSGAMLAVIKINTWIGSDVSRLILDAGSFGEQEINLGIGREFERFSLAIGGKWQDIIGQNLYYPEFSDSVIHGDEGNYRGLNVAFESPKLSFQGRYTQRFGALTAPIDPAQELYGTGIFEDRLLFTNVEFRTPIKDNQFIRTQVFVNYANRQQALISTFDTSSFQTKLQRSLWSGFSYRHQLIQSEKHRINWGAEGRFLPVSENFFEMVAFGFQQAFDSTLIRWGIWDIGVYLQDQYQFNEQWAVKSGLRFGLNSLSKPQLAPELAVSFTPVNATEIRFSYARGYRLPGLTETETNTTLGSMVNPALGPESVQNVELTLQQLIGKDLEFTLGLYGMRMEDLIGFPDEVVPQTPTLQNLEVLNFTGIEGGLHFTLFNQSKTYLAYNFPIRSSYEYNFPSPNCKFGLTAPFLRHFTFYTEGQYEGGRLTLQGQKTLPYFLLNTNLLIQPDIQTGGFLNDILAQSSLSFRVFNVLDQFYQHPQPLGSINPFTYQNGRTWQTQLLIKF